MKKLIFILTLCLSVTAFSQIPQTGKTYHVTVKEGKNFFQGKSFPFNFFGKDTLHYRFKLGPEWWTETWTKPILWGMKMLTVGRAPSYHRGGMNCGMFISNGIITIYPRYYERRKMYTENKLHELSQFGRVVNQEEWVDIIMVNHPRMEWWVNGELVHFEEADSPNTWFHWCYLGRRGWDLNYPGYDLAHNKIACAIKDLSMEIQILK